jgi:serine/threonine protein kinase
MSVASSSDSASIKERVVLHLNEFHFCVQVLGLIASNGAVPKGTSFIPLDLSTPDVEEASRRDSESLLRIVEGYKAKSVPQGAVEKLAEYVLRKLRATNSDHGYLHSIEYDDVKLKKLLGEGSFASVLRCELLGVKAAAKVFRTPDAAVQREAELQGRLRHPNVVQFIGYAVKQNQHIIVMELMEMDLRRYLEENVHENQSGPPLPLLLAVDIMLQLAEAMNYLHKSGMMHRDLKSNNVLINAVRSKESYFFPSLQVKLAGFTLSKLNLDNSRCWRWMAPEVCQDEKNTVKYTKAADVYSFAMVFFEVLTGRLPFEGVALRDLHQRVLTGERPILPPDGYCPVHVSALIERCWATMPEDRPQFHEICQMLWQCKAMILSHSSPHSSISNDADSIPSDAGSISNVAQSIPSDEDYDAGSILNDADSKPRDADSIPGDTNSSLRDTNSVAAVTLFKDCRDAATAVRSQCERVMFNKSLCGLLADTYSRDLHSDFDFTYTNKCQTILAELRRVISCGEMLVEQWTDKDWWMSVASSSDSASIKERVVLHLNEFHFCVQVLGLIASNGAVPEGTSFIPLDLSTPDVEEAYQRDIESLRSVLESYKTTWCPQGDVTKFAEDVLRKLRATNSDHGYLHSIEYDDVKPDGYFGKGSSAAVMKCEFLGVKAAVKVFKTPSSTSVDAVQREAELQARLSVQREAELQARLRHPNVIQFIGYAASEEGQIIVSEPMSKDLRMYLDENILEGQTRPPLSLLLAVNIMLQTGEGMKYLHQSGMIHRDLKAKNILINVVESKELCNSTSVQVKLTDFGSSKLKEATNSTMFTTKETGTTLWRAPEVFEGNTGKYTKAADVYSYAMVIFEVLTGKTPWWRAPEVFEGNTGKYTKAADVYSYAMVFFEVLTGQTPWFDAQGIATLQMSDLLPSILRGERPTLPPYCPADLSALITECWATKPAHRPQFHEICQRLLQCKARILSDSSPHSSPSNDGGDIGGIVTTDNSENLFQGPGMMANISAGDFRATIEYNDVQLKIEYLGQGGYADVFKCQFRGEMAAAKLFRTSNTIEVKAVQNEAKLLASLRHPNVVQFVGYAVKENQHYIITELMNKDLRMYLKNNSPLSLPLAVDIMLQIAEGMKYLHESGVMHRDLKATNVLINVVENESYISPSVQVKLADFGRSKLNLNNSRFTTMGVGTAQWRAPEVFQDEQNTEKYTNAGDVYSFALVFFEVLTGEVPFANISKSQILGKIRCGERPILPPHDYCPVHLSAVIKECWATRPEDRPKFPEICQRLRECKDTILSHSIPNASSQNSKR